MDDLKVEVLFENGAYYEVSTNDAGPRARARFVGYGRRTPVFPDGPATRVSPFLAAGSSSSRNPVLRLTVVPAF